MAGKKQHDDYSEIATAVVQEEVNMGRLKQKQKAAAAKVNQYVGRIQASEMLGRMATVASAVWLKEMKESKDYLCIGCSAPGTLDTR